MWNKTTEYHRPSTYAARNLAVIALRKLLVELHDEFASIEANECDGATLIVADGAELVRIAQFIESLDD